MSTKRKNSSRINSLNIKKTPYDVGNPHPRLCKHNIMAELNQYMVETTYLQQITDKYYDINLLLVPSKSVFAPTV
jgi:hypothetical protein